MLWQCCQIVALVILGCFSSPVVPPAVSLSVSPVMFSVAFSGRISGYSSPRLTQRRDMKWISIVSAVPIKVSAGWVRQDGKLGREAGLGT